jgi:hypothetical protein
MKTILSSRRHRYLAKVSIFLIMVALITGMTGCSGGNGLDPYADYIKIYNWADLDNIRDDLVAKYVLMNDLNATSAGYTELASPTANGGKGWEPIGSGPDAFNGTFNGQGYEIRDLFINRPDEDYVGLFGFVESGVIKDIGVVNATVTGRMQVGGLVADNYGTVSNSHFTGNVTGEHYVGGVVGYANGAVSNSHFTGNVTGEHYVGGVVGDNYEGIVSDCYSNGNVIACWSSYSSTAGGVVGDNYEGIVSDCYSNGNVIACGSSYSTAGGVVGDNRGTVSNCYSNGNVIACRGYFDNNAGGVVGVNRGTVSNSYSTGSVTSENGAGGLVGANVYYSTISNSYSTGNVTGEGSVGGLVGVNRGTVSNSYSSGNVTGISYVGGLVGDNYEEGIVTNSFWDTETSGQSTSDGGTGKNTTEMQDITTFSGTTWNITAVGNPGERDPFYIWNIVDNETYPFLSWQSVS